MIKKLLISSAVYFSAVGTTATENELSKEDKETLNQIEIINTAADMVGWIVEDVANGYVTDTVIADTYIDNLEIVITRTKKLREDE